MTEKEIEKVLKKILGKAVGFNNIWFIENNKETIEEDGFKYYYLNFMIDDRKMDDNNIDHNKMEKMIKEAFGVRSVGLDRVDAYPDGTASYGITLEFKNKKK